MFPVYIYLSKAQSPTFLPFWLPMIPTLISLYLISAILDILLLPSEGFLTVLYLVSSCKDPKRT